MITAFAVQDVGCSRYKGQHRAIKILLIETGEGAQCDVLDADLKAINKAVEIHREVRRRSASASEQMSVPDHLLRYPTAAAIQLLAQRLGLPNEPNMQDWPWEVSDANRLDEFLAVYREKSLSDDERFTVMETIIQSFDDLGESIVTGPRWLDAMALLDRNIDLHASSVWYWSSLENDNVDEQWTVTPYMRVLLAKHRSRLERRGPWH